MYRNQNYLDRFVVDTICLRVLSGEKSMQDLVTIFSELRQHEKPHIIVFRKNAETEETKVFDDFEFPLFGEVEQEIKNIRVWHSFHNFKWRKNNIEYHEGNKNIKTEENSETKKLKKICLSWTCESNNIDTRQDPKRRFEGNKTQLKYWLNVIGNVYYMEQRFLSQTVVMTRIYTYEAKSRIVREKIPLYVEKTNSIRGKFLYNITHQLETYYSTSLTNAMLQVKKLISKGNTSKEYLESHINFPKDLLETIELLQLIKIEEKVYKTTPRGNYFLYCLNDSSEK